MDTENLPWYRNLQDAQPFKLQLQLQFDESYDFSNVALFPWTLNSLSMLWDGEYADRNADEWKQWESVVADLYGAIAAVGNHKLYIKTHKYKYSVDLPEQKIYRPNDFSCAWALMNPSQALLLFNDGSVLHILDPIARNFTGSLAGHGGHITSIAVHPRLPHLFCTTARDFTTRIYDLTQRARQRPHNPMWPPRKSAPKAGVERLPGFMLLPRRVMALDSVQQF